MRTETEMRLPLEAADVDGSQEAYLERRRSLSLWALGGALVLGWLGSSFFVDRALGVSFPIFVALLIVTGTVAARQTGAKLRWGTMWLVVPILFFAVSVAIHAHPAITFLNLVLTLSLGMVWLHYLPLSETIVESSAAEYASAGIERSLATTVAPISALTEVADWMRSRSSQKSRTLLSVIRGLLLALPVVLVFGILLSSADAAFSSAIGSIWNLLGLGNHERLMSQVVVALLLAWPVCGGLVYVMLERSAASAQGALAPQQPDLNSDAFEFDFEDSPDGNGHDDRLKTHAKQRPILLNMIEACIMLGSVNFLFGLFVLIQFSYFFGGQANVTINGLTYAEYARRGFFELVAVAVLTLGLILVLDWVTVRSGQRQQGLFRGLAVVMVALTGVMMVSASQRMSLYEVAYGYTHLRVYVHIFIRWLAVLFGFFVLTLFRVRKHIFSLGVLVCAVGYGASLNLMNVESYIAERNIERYFAGSRLDGSYLDTFSVDAVEPMAALYQHPNTPQNVRDFSASWLYRHYLSLASLRETSGSTFLSAHYARDQAWVKLNTLAVLPADSSDLSECCQFESPFTAP